MEPEPELGVVTLDDDKPGKRKRPKKTVRRKKKPAPVVDAEDLSGSDEGPAPADSTNKLGDTLKQLLAVPVPSDKGPVLCRDTKVVQKIISEKAELRREKKERKEKRAIAEKDHVKPEVAIDARERELRRIATRGVVALFNAVAKEQKALQGQLEEVETAGEAKKAQVEKMSKQSFLDMLKGQVQPQTQTQKKQAAKKSAGASYLSDDYLLGAKHKDWNKEESESEQDNDEDDEEEPDLSD